MPDTTTDSVNRRRLTSRTMIAEDARWAMDVILSSLRSPKAQGVIPLVIGHHLVRIAYEGSVALQASNPAVGIPPLADLIGDKFSTITARTRHTSKVLDNTSTNYQSLIAELEAIQNEHNRRFTGNTYKWLRWLESDLGLYRCARSTVGATVPAAYRLGFNLTKGGPSAEDIREVSEEWGGTLSILGAATLDTSEPEPTIDFCSARIALADRLAARYLNSRFDKDFPLGLKELILMIEGDLNAARTLLPMTSSGHEFPVFRAQVVAVYHSLSSLSTIAELNSSSVTAGSAGLRALLDDAPTKRLLSREGRNVRNRCVHYEIRDSRVDPDPMLPMFGIVESVYPGNTWARYHEDVKGVTHRLGDHLAEWTA